MKKLLLIFLSIIMCLSVFASCDTETDNSSDVSVLSDNENLVDKSESSMAVSDDSSESDESENPYISNLPYDYVIPEFDETKVIYNPNTVHAGVHLDMGPFPPPPNFGVPFDKEKLIVLSTCHEGLQEYIENNEVPDDAWFPVYVRATQVYLPAAESNPLYEPTLFDGLQELLERIGFLVDNSLEEKITNPDHIINHERAITGYINMDMLWKIHRDGYSRVVKFEWFPEKCEVCGFSAE